MCPLTRGQLSGRACQQLLLTQLLSPSQNRLSLQTHMSPTGSRHDPASLPPWPLRTQQKQDIHSHHSHHLPQGRPETLRLTVPPPQGAPCIRCRTHTGHWTNVIKLCWPHPIIHLFPNTCSGAQVASSHPSCFLMNTRSQELHSLSCSLVDLSLVVGVPAGNTVMGEEKRLRSLLCSYVPRISEKEFS